MKCRKCDIELTVDNWFGSLRTHNSYICNKCHSIVSMERYIKERESKGIKPRTQWNGKCRECGIELNDDNWYGSYKEQHYYLCIKCNAIKSKTYHIKRKHEDPTYLNKNSEYNKKHRKEIKQFIINKYGGKCECCGETNPEFLTIDHIDGNGSQHRKEIGIGCGNAFYIWLRDNNFPKDNFRLLCMNCNFSIGMYGYCPHKKLGAFPT